MTNLGREIRNMEQVMERTTDKNAQASKDERVVLMYPGNQLKEQVRDVNDTLSAFKVVKETFFASK